MLFNNPPKLAAPGRVAQFVQNELFSWCQTISTGLYKLDFLQNFEQFHVTGLQIPNGETVQIPNGFRGTRPSGAIPRGRVIVFQQGNGFVTDGIWTVDFVELINNGPADTTVSVVFFK